MIQGLRYPLKSAYPDFWEETVGILRGVTVDEEFVYVEIASNLLAFSKGSRDAEYAIEYLEGVTVGSRIGILRTDLKNKPLLIRLIAKPSTSS